MATPEKMSEKDIHRMSSLDDAKIQYSEDENSIIEGSEGVTQKDMDTYRHVADRLPLTAWLVVIVEFAERYFYDFSLAFFTSECRDF